MKEKGPSDFLVVPDVLTIKLLFLMTSTKLSNRIDISFGCIKVLLEVGAVGVVVEY